MLSLILRPFASWVSRTSPSLETPRSFAISRQSPRLPSTVAVEAMQRQTSGAIPNGIPWNDIVDLCRSKLSAKDLDIVCKFGSIEELVAYGVALQVQHQNTSKAHDLARLSVFFQQLRTFHASLDILAHVQPSVVAPLWGSIRLCIELVQETNEVFQMIVDMFDEINGTIPRIGTYIQILGHPESLIEPCQEVHLLVAEFACLVISYYRSYPFKNLVVATWKPFRLDFDKIITKIRRKTSHIELEVKTLSLQLDVSRHEEIRRLINTMDIKTRARLPCYFVPHPRFAGFVGREIELDSMATHLRHGTGTQLAVSLFGLGGVGKTQIALEYLSDKQEMYQAIFWISADNSVKLGQDVRAALIKLGLLASEAAESDQQCLSMFTEWLSETDEPWLLVIDNADELKAIRACWPSSGHGHIIVTSRDPAASRYPSLSKAMKGIQVNPLSDIDSAALLLAMLQQGWGSDPEEELHDNAGQNNTATDFARQLGGLPLAINQIASYILDTNCTLDECWQIYSDVQSRNTLFSQEPSNFGYEHSLGSVWQLSMSRVHEANPESSHLLQLMALLDPDGVPEDLLDGKDRLYDHNPRSSIDYLGTKIKMLNATKALLQQSMIIRSRTTRQLSMHRLVSAITRVRMSTEDRQDRFDDALELLHRQFPRLSVERTSLSDQWPRCRLYIAQVMALELSFRECDPPLAPRSQFCELLSNACWFLFEQGLLGQAMQMLPTARAVGRATLPESRFALSTVHRALGGLFLDINRPRDALESFSQVLELRKGISELGTAQGLTNVALADLALGDVTGAKSKIDKAKEIYARHPTSALGAKAIMFDVSGLIEAQSGNTEAGIQLVKEAVALYDRDRGPGNYWTAFCNYEIGNMYMAIPDTEAAFKYHTSSLSVRRDKLGQTYSTAASLHKVALLSHTRKSDKGAEELLLQALKIYSEIFEGKGGLSRSNYLMSMILHAQGRDEDASNCKAFAGQLRQELTGVPPEVDDELSSYDNLVGFQDR